MGQKLGVYHVFDARTGEVVWRRQLGVPLPSGGISGIQWQTPNPADGCTTGGAAQYPEVCTLAHGPAVSSSPGVVYEGTNDGKLRAYSASTGRVLWTYDTVRDFTGVNGLPGRGGSISGGGGGAVVSNGMVYVQSGYLPAFPNPDGGHVMLAFGL